MKIAEIATVVSATAFILTVVYTYGFSNAVDVDLLKYFSVNDYIKLSVYWMPKYIILWGIGYCIVKIGDLSPGNSSKNKNFQSSYMPAFLKFILKHATLIFSVVCIGIPSIILMRLRYLEPNYVPYSAYGLYATGLWCVFSHYILRPKFFKEWTGWKEHTLYWVPIILIGVYCYGAATGQSDLDSVDKHPTSQLEMTIEVPSKSGKVLFALTQYIVFLEQKSKKVEIIPVSQVKSIIPIPEKKSKEKKGTTK